MRRHLTTNWLTGKKELMDCLEGIIGYLQKRQPNQAQTVVVSQTTTGADGAANTNANAPAKLVVANTANPAASSTAQAAAQSAIAAPPAQTQPQLQVPSQPTDRLQSIEAALAASNAQQPPLGQFAGRMVHAQQQLVKCASSHHLLVRSFDTHAHRLGYPEVAREISADEESKRFREQIRALLDRLLLQETTFGKFYFEIHSHSEKNSWIVGYARPPFADHGFSFFDSQQVREFAPQAVHSTLLQTSFGLCSDGAVLESGVKCGASTF